MKPQTPFVCLHGFTGTPDAFGPLALERTWAPRLTGHGPNPDLSSLSFEDEVQRIASGIEVRFGAPIRLLGYSMGARVALGLLDRFPHLFSEATLIGVNPGLESEAARQDRLGWEARWIDVLQQDGVAVFEHQWKAQPLFKTQLSLPPRSQDAQRSARLTHTAPGLVHALSVLGLGSMPNYWPRLATINPPLTFVYGEQDEKFSALALRAQSLSKNIRKLSLPGVGHNPLIEAPDLLAELLANS